MTRAGKTGSRKAQKQEEQFHWTNVSEIKDETKERVRSQIVWRVKLYGIFSNGTAKTF